MDQGSTMKRSAVHNFAPTVTKFCVMWEGLSLPHDTKFGNSRCEIVGRRVIFIWSLIHGLRWSGLIKVGPVCQPTSIWPSFLHYHLGTEVPQTVDFLKFGWFHWKKYITTVARKIGILWHNLWNLTIYIYIYIYNGLHKRHISPFVRLKLVLL